MIEFSILHPETTVVVKLELHVCFAVEDDEDEEGEEREGGEATEETTC